MGLFPIPWLILLITFGASISKFDAKILDMVFHIFAHNTKATTSLARLKLLTTHISMIQGLSIFVSLGATWALELYLSKVT